MYRKSNDKTRAFLAIFITTNAAFWAIIALALL